MFWDLYALLLKEILQLISGALKMLNYLRPRFLVLIYKYDFGVFMTPFLRKFCNLRLKILYFRHVSVLMDKYMILGAACPLA